MNQTIRFSVVVSLCGVLGPVAVGRAQSPSKPSPSSASKPSEVQDLSPVLTDGVILPQIRGTWRARGYGYVFSFEANDASMISVSGAGAWRVDDMDALDVLCRVNPTGKTARITPHERIPGFMLERIDELPAIRPRVDWTREQVFSALTSTMSEFYPFFEERSFDWPARVKKHRAMVSDKTTDTELFAVFESLLEGLNDGHVSLSAEIDGESRVAHASGADTYSRLQAAFESQSEIGEFRAFRSKWIDRFKHELETDALGGAARFVCNRKFVWGRVGQDVGYLFITGMGGFADGDMQAQIDALHEGLSEILAKLADTKAMIVDVSLNRGGMDLFSLEIASHFADARRLGFSKFPATAKDYRQDVPVEPFVDAQGAKQTYTKPIYLVTNSVTASAAEIFTMCMRAFPHVQSVGQPTAGALSDILEKTLPNGVGIRHVQRDLPRPRRQVSRRRWGSAEDLEEHL